MGDMAPTSVVTSNPASNSTFQEKWADIGQVEFRCVLRSRLLVVEIFSELVIFYYFIILFFIVINKSTLLT